MSAQSPGHWILEKSYLGVKWPAPDADWICLVPRVCVGGAALHCTICLHGARSANPTTCDDVSKHCIPCDVNPAMCSSLRVVLLPRGIRHIATEASIMPVLRVLPIRTLSLWTWMSEGRDMEVVTVLVTYWKTFMHTHKHVYKTLQLCMVRLTELKVYCSGGHSTVRACHWCRSQTCLRKMIFR